MNIIEVIFDIIRLNDHLNWELFHVQELKCFNEMFSMLLKKDIEHIVMSYEIIRQMHAHVISYIERNEPSCL